MYITREIAKVLVTLTPAQVEVIHPDFNPDNWQFLVALSQGKEVRIGSRILTALRFDSAPENYTIVQPTIRIGEIDVPAPETEMLAYKREYFVADPAIVAKYQLQAWGDDTFDHIMLNRHRIHLTKAAAVAHADAEILAAGGKV